MTARPALALAPLAALLAVAGATAAPGPAVHLQLGDPGLLPFSDSQLRTAVAARLPLAPAGAAAVVVTVAPGGPGQIEVASPLRRQQVSAAGPATETARLVALAVVDVARDPAAGFTALPATPAAELVGAPSAPASQGRGPVAGGFQAWALAGSSFGFTGAGAAFEPTVGADYFLSTPWRLRGSTVTWGPGLALGYARGDAAIPAGAVDRAFRLETMPLRLGASLGWRWLQVSAGPVLRLYRTSGVDGGQGSLGGGFVSLRAHLPVAGGFRAQLAVSADGYTESLDFRAGALSVVRSQFIVPSVGVGLAWGRS